MSLPEPSRRIDQHRSEALADGWGLLRAHPGAYSEPSELPRQGWSEVRLPGTVAHWLGVDSCDGRGLDSFDWWLRRELPELHHGDGVHRLRFDGLATLADVWVDGDHVLGACNMHRGFVVPVPAGACSLVLRFAALGPRLQARHPRPHWKTALVGSQNLRWFRTTLLGRVASWLPHVDAVGPWRPIHLEQVRLLDVQELHLVASLRCGRAVVRVSATWRDLGGGPWGAATLRVGPYSRTIDPQRLRADGIDEHEIEFEGLEPWWPHTHGRPALYPCELQLQGVSAGAMVDCGSLGFKSFDMQEAAAALRVQLNGVPLFLRGACWSSADLRRLDADDGAVEALLERVVACGMNMLRIVGTGVYANEAFHAACDRLGILVWQDFMYASMDYPLGDAEFVAEARAEAEQALRRMSRHACVGVYCGNSEVEQQAAMLGLAAEAWSQAFFDQWLPTACARLHPGTAYLRSSPSGGELPFHPSTGVSHYYGVGAYRRPLADARLAGVRFAAECLGLSNVPAQDVLERGELAGVAPHDPRWKAGVPRDAGAGWDFEDVRDHYFPLVVRADAWDMRLTDPQGYLRWSALVSGEVMARTFAVWRAPDSGCQGALVWWLQDLLPGAGWGVLDHRGQPKPAYWALKRCLAPRAVLIEDRGLEGCDFIVCNDLPRNLQGEVTVELWQDGQRCTLQASYPVRLEPGRSLRVGTAGVFGHFVDINHVYRFGAPFHDAVVARLCDDAGDVVSEAFYFPGGMSTAMAGVAPRLRMEADGADRLLYLESDRMLLGVHIDAPGYEPEDNAFHLAPGRARSVRLRAVSSAAFARVHCSAANLRDGVTVRDA